MEAENERAPDSIREGVRSGILATIRQDVELRGGRAARLLLAAGFAGVAGGLGATLLVAAHPYDHHPPWHVVVFSSVWAGLLVVAFSVAFLQLRTPRLPLARSAAVGLLGLGLAGICGIACPDQHFLAWWSGFGVGAAVATTWGSAASALCFGFVATLAIGLLSSLVVPKDQAPSAGTRLLPAAALVLLLAPGVVLQSFDTSIAVFCGWIAGTAAGAYMGVVWGAWVGARVARRTTTP